MQQKYNQVEKLLDERVNGNEQRKERAERLHKQTTDLLTKIRAHNDDAEGWQKESRSYYSPVLTMQHNFAALKRSADSLDVELGGFRQRIDVLGHEIDKIATQIDTRVDYHATCDT